MIDFKSGYDRGHMVPAADAKISQKAMDETFYLSNIAPQVGDGFNRHCEWLFGRNFDYSNTALHLQDERIGADGRLGIPRRLLPEVDYEL